MDTAVVFISREQPPHSPFRRTVEAAGHRVHGESLIRLTPVAFGEPPATDWIFFYSPRAVAFFAAAARPEAEQRLAAIGPGTAAACSRAGWRVDFIGQGSPAEVARAFLPVAAGQRVLFPQARQSRRSVEKAIAEQIDAVPLIVYDNEIRPTIALPKHHIAVFTSPLNVRAYMRYYPPRGDVMFVAIGPSTAAAMRAAGITRFRLADSPDEQALARAVLTS